jgi:hypothetical protein
MRLIGNDSAREALAAAMASGALHHAWLIAGPEGVGKGMFARQAPCACFPRLRGAITSRPGWDVPGEPDRRIWSPRARIRIIASWSVCPRIRTSPTKHWPARSPSPRSARLQPLVRDQAELVAPGDRDRCDRRSRARWRQCVAQESGRTAGRDDLPAGEPCAGPAAADDPLALPAAALRAAARRRCDGDPARASCPKRTATRSRRW